MLYQMGEANRPETPAVITVLLKNGADINIADENGNVALHWISDETYAILFENGANVNILNKKGQSVFLSHRDPEALTQCLHLGLDVMHANQNHNFVNELFKSQRGHEEDITSDKYFSEFLAASESLRNNILYMLSNYPTTEKYYSAARKFYAKLISTYPEVIIGAAKAGYVDELAKVQNLNLAAMKVAFEYARSFAPSLAIDLIKYLLSVPEDFEKVELSKLDSAIATKNPDIVLIASSATDIFEQDAEGETGVEKILENFGPRILEEIIYHKFANAAFRGKEEYNRVVLGKLYSTDLLEVAEALIEASALALNGTVEECSNIIHRALRDGKFEWVDMLLDHGMADYSPSGLVDELEYACNAPNLLLSDSSKVYKDEEFNDKLNEYIEIIKKITLCMKFPTPQTFNEIMQEINYAQNQAPESGFAAKCIMAIKEALSDRAETNEEVRTNLPLIEKILVLGITEKIGEFLIDIHGDLQVANNNHKLVFKIFEIASDSRQDAIEILASFLLVSESLQKHILHMLSNYCDDESQNELLKAEAVVLYGRLVDTHPEVIIGAVWGGHFEELKKICRINPNAILNAREYVEQDTLSSAALAYAIDDIGISDIVDAASAGVLSICSDTDNIYSQDVTMLGEIEYS